MTVFRIVLDKIRTTDLSGTGAFLRGGRWNCKGTYMLYTSENSSLAFLENIVPFDQDLMPPQMYTMEIEIKNASFIRTLAEKDYPKNWMKLSVLANQTLGDSWMREKTWLGIRVKSAINPSEYNVLLNPLHPQFNDLVEVRSIQELSVDPRIIQAKKKP